MYECTGSLLSSNIDAIIGVLLDEPFAAAYEMTHVLCKAKVLGKGYALADVVTCIVELVVDLALPAAAFAPMAMVALADIKYIEHRRADRSSSQLEKYLSSRFRVLCAYTSADQ